MKILVVEDEEKLAILLEAGLKQAGFVVDTLADGEEGLLYLSMHHQEIDLVILDVMLPGKDGFEICREARERGITIPVLFLTAKDSLDDKVEGFDNGADDYLVKPFAFKELIRRVRALLRRPKTIVPTSLKTRDLTLFPQEVKVIRNKREIPLTAKELKILEYFMLNAGRIINKRQILSNLWEYFSEPSSNIIEAHIKNLRKKIDYGEDEPLLETIKGTGYRLKS